MRIEDFIPTADPGGGSGIVARFAIRLTPDAKLVGYRLRQRDDGTFRMVPPSVGGNTSAHFAPDLYRSITNAAIAAFEGHYAVDRSAA